MFTRKLLSRREALSLQAESARNRCLRRRIRELEAYCRTLEQNQRSPHDPLTGTLTNEEFVRKAEKILSTHHRRAGDKTSPPALVMIDLDHFKEVNDTFGHQAGDSVLRAFGEITQKHLRESDLVCRRSTGGDEFMILLHDEAASENVQVVIGKLRKKFEQIKFPFYRGKKGAEKVRPSFSFGVAYCRSKGDVLEKMAARADSLLYKEKRGRKSSR